MCGIYAHNDPCEVPGMGVPHSQQVHGVVRGWGKVVLHQKGWRAAVAQIAALLDPGPEAKNRDYVYEAAFVYDVPVIEGLGALKAFVDRGGEA